MGIDGILLETFEGGCTMLRLESHGSYLSFVIAKEFDNDAEEILFEVELAQITTAEILAGLATLNAAMLQGLT